MKKGVVNFSASVRQRLLNLASERKEDFGLVLTRYGLERFLYRLSVSPHRDLFVLKGALLLQVWTGETYRPTRDLDLLGKGMSNPSYQEIFSDVCSQDVEDDGLSFLSETIRLERIRDEEAYEGVRVLLEARLGNVRIPLQIDVGFGDAIVPAAEELEFPTLLKSPAPKLNAYPKESVVAEKFEAIVKLGMANSRMKDFYDLWVLAQRFQFESATLAAAIQATFATRQTVLPISLPLAFQADFYELPSKQSQWKAFLRKSDAGLGRNLERRTTLRAGVCPRPQRSSASMSCSWLFLGGLVSTRARFRFTNRRTACDTRVLPVENFSANGKQCLIRLSQPRGPLQPLFFV